MSLIKGIFGKRSAVREDLHPTGYEAIEAVLADLKKQRAAGVSVTPDAAIRYPAVFACIRIIAESVASLPLIMYERQERGRRRAQEHPLYGLLHDSPNPMMTALEYREALQGHLSAWGNAYSQIEYNASGRPVELWPLRPDRMLEIRIQNGQRSYHYQLPNGGMQWISGDKIWHLRGLGSDGYIGYSPIRLFMQSIGLGIAAESFGARFFANDARPGFVLIHPTTLTQGAHDRLKKDFSEEHEGVERSHRLAVLEEGLQLKEVGIPPEDAQFLETRKFQVTEIARIFRVPPHMVGDLEKATFSNIEHQGIEFVVYTLRPWLVRWEQSIALNLMFARERGRIYPEHLVDGLLRGDMASRYQAYGIGWGRWLSTNTILELENMNPEPGGDTLLMPLNMIPAPTRAQKQGEIRAVRVDENRTMRSATARHRLREAYLGIYKDTAVRMLRIEARDIMASAKKIARTRNIPAWNEWIDGYYEKVAESVKRQMGPVNHSYVQAASAEAQDEVSAKIGMTDELESFSDSYTGTYARRHVEISKYRLNQAVMKAQNDPESDLFTAIDEEVSTWEDGRSGEIAQEESTRLGGAVAKEVFIMAGFTLFRWVTIGKTCPYCSMLDGKVVGKDQFFLAEGEGLNPEGQEPLTTSTSIGHPPAHSGCDCMIAAEG